MDAQALATRPCVLHEHVGCDVLDLADDVELAQAVEAVTLVGDCLKLVAVLVKDFADRMQPVIHEAAPLAVHRRGTPPHP